MRGGPVLALRGVRPRASEKQLPGPFISIFYCEWLEHCCLYLAIAKALGTGMGSGLVWALSTLCRVCAQLVAVRVLRKRPRGGKGGHVLLLTKTSLLVCTREYIQSQGCFEPSHFVVMKQFLFTMKFLFSLSTPWHQCCLHVRPILKLNRMRPREEDEISVGN